MRDADRLVRHRRSKARLGARRVGCLILVLCGCVPAVVMTSTYVTRENSRGARAALFRIG